MNETLRHRFDETYGLLRQQIAQVEEQITPRVRLGAIGVVVLILLYLASVLLQMGHAQRSDIDRLRQDIAFQEQSLEGIDWTSRARASADKLDELRQRFWPGSTAGLAQASFEKWLRDNFEANGLKVNQLQVRVSAVLDQDGISEEMAAKLQRISAKVLANFDDRGLDNVLLTLSQSPYFITVERLNIRADRTMRLELDVQTLRLNEERGE